MELTKSLLILALISLIPGQLVRLPFFGPSGAITISDITVAVLNIYFIYYSLVTKKSFLLSKKTFFPALIFSLWATAATILASLYYSQNQILIALLFLLRFIGYFFISQIVISTVSRDKVKNWFNLILTVITTYAVLGFLQLVIFPDLTFLTLYGWDPHIKRVASTLLDPNFSGILFVFAFIISTVYYLQTKGNQKFLYLVSGLISSFAILYTFSRSSYLAFLAAIIIIGLAKSKKLLIALVAFSLLAIIIFPAARSRVVGALTFDDTAQARVESWQNALEIFSKNPVIGVGFNTYRFAQQKYQLFEDDPTLGGHSGAGSDSSILLVAATTGTIGLVIFLWFLVTVAKKRNIICIAAFLALLVHSQFVNSFFFPQVMLFFWFIEGLIQVDDS